MPAHPLATRAARHLALPQLGPQGQEKIDAASVLLIGVGGIGCAAATYLASSGVGQLSLADFDTVDETNLGRQILYSPADVGQLKAECATAKLLALNPDIRISPITDRLTGRALADAVTAADIVLDGCDNFATRFAVNEACVAAKRRLVSAAAIRLEGQLATFGPDYRRSPCYRCLYTEADESLDDCSGAGVLAPVPGVIGALAAVECLKFVADIGSEPGRMTLFDATSMEWRELGIAKRTECPICGQAASAAAGS